MVRQLHLSAMLVLLLVLTTCGQAHCVPVQYPHVIADIFGEPLVLEQRDFATGTYHFSFRCANPTSGGPWLPTTIRFNTTQDTTAFTLKNRPACDASGAPIYQGTWPGLGTRLQNVEVLTISLDMAGLPGADPPQHRERHYQIMLTGDLQVCDGVDGR